LVNLPTDYVLLPYVFLCAMGFTSSSYRCCVRRARY